MFTRLPPDPGGIIEAPVEKNVILALREQSINTARRGTFYNQVHFSRDTTKTLQSLQEMNNEGSLRKKIRLLKSWLVYCVDI